MFGYVNELCSYWLHCHSTLNGLTFAITLLEFPVPYVCKLAQLQTHAELLDLVCDIRLYRDKYGALPPTLEALIPEFRAAIPSTAPWDPSSDPATLAAPTLLELPIYIPPSKGER